MSETNHHALLPEIKAPLSALVSNCFQSGKQLLTVMGFDDIDESIAGSDEEPTALVLCICIPRAKALRLYEQLTHLVKFEVKPNPKF